MSRRSWFLFASLGLLAYGVLCLVRFPIERRRAMAVPRMTCGQLLQKGAVEGEYVTLTDVRLCCGGFAFWRDAMSPGDVDVFVPAYPATLQSEPPPRDLKLLLEVQDTDDWQRIRNAGVFELTCQVHLSRTRRRLGAKTSRDQVSRYTICESGGVDGRSSRADDGKGRQPAETWYGGNLSRGCRAGLAPVAPEGSGGRLSTAALGHVLVNGARGMNIFLSYSSDRRDIAEQVSLALTGSGHKVFFDRDSLPAGDDYHVRIRKGVENSDVFVFLISPRAVAPGSYALTELKYARQKWPDPRRKDCR